MNCVCWSIRNRLKVFASCNLALLASSPKLSRSSSISRVLSIICLENPCKARRSCHVLFCFVLSDSMGFGQSKGTEKGRSTQLCHQFGESILEHSDEGPPLSFRKQAAASLSQGSSQWEKHENTNDFVCDSHVTPVTRYRIRSVIPGSCGSHKSCTMVHSTRLARIWIEDIITARTVCIDSSQKNKTVN